MKRARPGRLLLLATLSLTTAYIGPAISQDGTGVRAKLSVSSGLEFSDNLRLDQNSPGDTYTSVTDLGFRLTSETRNERLNFGLTGRLEGSEGDGATSEEDFRLSRRGANLDYRRQNATSRFAFRGRYDKVEVEDDIFGFLIDGEFDPNALVIDRGDVTRTSLSTRLQTGLEGPLGFDVSAAWRERDYSDETDPDLEDREQWRFDTTAEFRIRASLALRARAGINDTDEEDGFDRLESENKYVGFGVQSETAGGLFIVGDILLDDSSTDRNGVFEDDDDGLGLELSITQARTDGEIGFDLSSRIDESGRRTIASVRRAIEMPTGGLSFSLGLVEQDSDLEFTSSLEYFRETPVGTVTANILQRPSTSASEAILNTAVNLGITRALTPVSDIGATFRYGASRDFGESTDDRRATIGVNYRRDITRDWDLNAGYEYTRVEDDVDDWSRNTVYFNIGRDFDFGF